MCTQPDDDRTKGRFLVESVAKLFCWERTNFLTAAEAFDVSGLGGPRAMSSLSRDFCLGDVLSFAAIWVKRKCVKGTEKSPCDPKSILPLFLTLSALASRTFKRCRPEINREAVLRRDWRRRRIGARADVCFVSYPLGGNGGAKHRAAGRAHCRPHASRTSMRVWLPGADRKFFHRRIEYPRAGWGLTGWIACAQSMTPLIYRNKT